MRSVETSEVVRGFGFGRVKRPTELRQCASNPRALIIKANRQAILFAGDSLLMVEVERPFKDWLHHRVVSCFLLIGTTNGASLSGNLVFHATLDNDGKRVLIP
jgi:hypothetical protein